MPGSKWIIVRNWQRFQHYGGARRPLWIKNYTELLHKDEYLDLPLAARGLLHGIWLAYADRDGRLRQSDLPAALLARARDAHLASLNDAGLIGFSASKPLPLPLNTVDARAREDTTAPNLHVARAAKRERLHDELLNDARLIAADWNGGGSDLFDERIERLECEYHHQLSFQERERLWEAVLENERRR